MPRQFDEIGDLALTEDGTDFVLAHDAYALAQHIGMGFLVLPGTWKFDRQEGFPLIQATFVTTLTIPLVALIIRRYLENFEGVERVDYVKVTPVRDEYDQVIAHIQFSVETSFGTINETDAFLPLIQDL